MRMMQSLTSGLGNQHAAINASMASSIEEFSTQKLKRQYVRRSKQYRIFKLHPWTTLLVAVTLGLVILIAGGYVFNWSWTGFSDNKLSDWLKLLLVPFVLPLVSVWYTNHPIKLSSSVSLEDEDIQEAQPYEKASE